MSSRWLRIDVDMQRHPVVGAGQPIKPADPERGSFSRYEAWTWLLSNAAWRAHDVRNNGRVERLDVGQCLAAREYLARQWNWTVKTVSIFLEKLRAAGMVEWGQSEGRFARVLTICNYEAFQQPKGPQRAVVGLIDGQFRGSSGAYKHQEHQRHQTDKPLPPTPNNDERKPNGGGDGSLRICFGTDWTQEAIAAVADIRRSSAHGHVATRLLDVLCGTRNPPKGVDAPSWVRELRDKLGAFPPAVLDAVAATIGERQTHRFPVANDVLAIAKGEAAKARCVDSVPAGATPSRVSIGPHSPEWPAYLAHLERTNPDAAKYYRRRSSTVSVASDVLANIVDSHRQSDGDFAASCVSSVKIITVEAARERAA